MENQASTVDSTSKTTERGLKDSTLPIDLQNALDRVAKARIENQARQESEAENERIRREAWEADAPNREAQRQRMEEADRIGRIERLHERAQFPPRYRHTLADYQPVNAGAVKALAVCQAYADSWQTAQATGKSLILSGYAGTGKTMLACALGNEIIQRHFASVRYVKAGDMLREVKSTYSKTAKHTEEDVISRYAKYDLLMIDEVGVQFGTDAERVILFEIVNARYERIRPTVLISNLAVKALGDIAGERVIDRMRENGGQAVVFEWGSYRGASA